MNIANIINTKNDKMRAVVNTNFKLNKIDNTKININFDIEVNYNISEAVLNEEKLKNYLFEMRDFKNKIFFANIPNAEEVFK